MLLRTRITLIVALSLLLIVLGLGSAGLLREQLLQQRLATTALAGQASLWGEMLAAEDRLLDQGLDQLLADSQFLQAARQRNRVAMEKILHAAQLLPGPAQPLALVALISARQEPLVWGLALQRPLLDSVSLERAANSELVGGLRLGTSSAPLVLSARVLPPQDPAGIEQSPVVLVLARHAQHALQRFAERTGAHANLIDLRSQLSASTDALLWQRTPLQISPRTASTASKWLTGAPTSSTAPP